MSSIDRKGIGRREDRHQTGAYPQPGPRGKSGGACAPSVTADHDHSTTRMFMRGNARPRIPVQPKPRIILENVRGDLSKPDVGDDDLSTEIATGLQYMSWLASVKRDGQASMDAFAGQWTTRVPG